MAKKKKSDAEAIDLKNPKWRDFDRFMKTVPIKSGATNMILRCHLLAEYYLDQLIIAEFKRGDVITDSLIGFYDKTVIVEALDLFDPGIITSLRKLNKVRNDCSHVLDYQLSEADIEKIGRPLGTSYLDKKKQYGEKLPELLHWTLLVLMARVCGGTNSSIEDRLARELKKPATQ